MRPLTAKQQQLLAYLQACDLCPSSDEMREHLGLKSKSTVTRLLDALEERGFISRLRNRVRAITVHDRAPDLSAVPTEYLLAELGRRKLAA